MIFKKFKNLLRRNQRDPLYFFKKKEKATLEEIIYYF